MVFELEITKDFEETYRKMTRKNPEFKKAIDNKVQQILENPYRFKPMRTPLQGFRRVHIMKSFVLLYLIKEKENSVLLAKIAHHDEAYR